MRAVGLLLLSAGGTALAYAGASVVGDFIVAQAGQPPGLKNEILLVVGIGAICVTIGLSLLTRTPSR